MAQYTERNAKLRELCVTQSELDQLKQLASTDGAKEVRWRVMHEMKMHMKWAQDRAAFILDEVLTVKPKERPPKRLGEPGIQSHAIGRPGASSQHYGEKFG